MGQAEAPDGPPAACVQQIADPQTPVCRGPDLSGEGNGLDGASHLKRALSSELPLSGQVAMDRPMGEHGPVTV